MHYDAMVDILQELFYHLPYLYYCYRYRPPLFRPPSLSPIHRAARTGYLLHQIATIMMKINATDVFMYYYCLGNVRSFVLPNRPLFHPVAPQSIRRATPSQARESGSVLPSNGARKTYTVTHLPSSNAFDLAID